MNDRKRIDIDLEKKLTNIQKQEIRWLYANTIISCESLAQQYKISPKTIKEILKID